jgi:hypothetical protein
MSDSEIRLDKRGKNSKRAPSTPSIIEPKARHFMLKWESFADKSFKLKLK